MKRLPLILVSPDFEPSGSELSDPAISLSVRYLDAMAEAGGVPLALPSSTDPAVIAASVRAADGVMLTGGDDLDPRLYSPRVSRRLHRTVEVTPDYGIRDLRELLLIDEVFRQRKPLLAICRGHQLVNVALGGTLYVDLPAQRPGSINHRRLDRRCQVVHEVRLTPGSLLAKITGRLKLGVNSTHHQAVARVAAPLQVAGTSQDGVVESLELKPEAVGWLPWFLSVQFHPERLVDRHAEHLALFRAFAQACSRNGIKKL
jgi:putative glutamine amidotransferase